MFCSLKSRRTPAVPVPNPGFQWPFPVVGAPGACSGWDCSQHKGGVTHQGQTLPGRGLAWHLGNQKAKCHKKGVLGTHCGVHVALVCPLPGSSFGGCAGLPRSFPRPWSCNLSPLGLYINHPSCQAFTGSPFHPSETWSLESGCVA